jgi:hypothetical protein
MSDHIAWLLAVVVKDGELENYRGPDAGLGPQYMRPFGGFAR